VLFTQLLMDCFIHSAAIICPCVPFMRSDKAFVSWYMNITWPKWQITASSFPDSSWASSLGWSQESACTRVQGTRQYRPDHRCNIDPHHSPCGSDFHHTAGPQVNGKDTMDYQSISMHCSIMQSSATYSCPCLSYHRGMARPLGLSDPPVVGWHEEYHRVDCRWLEVNHQQDATQLRNFYYFTYVNGSTCFDRYVAHHQEPQLY
jgi:hypothetical protein